MSNEAQTNERTTKTITTTGGHKVVIKDFITGREKREITNIYLRDMEMKQKGGESELSGLKGTVASEAEDKAIELIVVSVNDSEKKVLEKVLNLPSEDYDEVVEAINEVTEPRKKSQSS